MCLFCSMAYGGAAVTLALGGTAAPSQPGVLATESYSTQQFIKLQVSPEAIKMITIPQIKEPQWLVDQKAAERAAAEAAQRKSATLPGQKITVTYDVTTKGTVTADLAEFKQQANATLNDSRGWARLGVFFQEVKSGGQFTLVLSEASQVGTYAGCSAEYSCNVGRLVIINQDRWTGATTPWNAAGGSLRDYRHMVVNHETGHWLGHGHRSCGGAGQAAPVMQQQSIDLQGCSFNPWPLQNELSSTRLGIKL